MRIILSPAKKMNIDEDSLDISGMPVFLDRTKKILKSLRAMSYEELKNLWKCSDKFAEENFERLRGMELERFLTPAVLSYEGLAYKYMAPAVFEYAHLDYIQKNLRILSAFYGVLKPLDGVTPYRLEMQARIEIDGSKNLYEFWDRSLYEETRDDSGIIVNLASKEYSKCIEKYVIEDDRYITCTFVEKSGDKLITKGTYAKMARGEMVRFMAEHNIEDPEDIKKFNHLGYGYNKRESSDKEYVFERHYNI